MRTSPVLKGFNCLEEALCIAMERGPNDDEGEWKLEVGETESPAAFMEAVRPATSISLAADISLSVMEEELEVR